MIGQSDLDVDRLSIIKITERHDEKRMRKGCQTPCPGCEVYGI